MMCGFDAECVAIVANVRFVLAFFPDSCSHALASKPHTIFYSVYLIGFKYNYAEINSEHCNYVHE